MRSINLHLILIALVTTAAASVVPAEERGTPFSFEGFCVIVSHSQPSLTATAMEAGSDEGFLPGGPPDPGPPWGPPWGP